MTYQDPEDPDVIDHRIAVAGACVLGLLGIALVLAFGGRVLYALGWL